LSANVFFTQNGTLKVVITDVESNEETINATVYDEAGKFGFLKNIELAHQKNIVKINNMQIALVFSNVPY